MGQGREICRREARVIAVQKFHDVAISESPPMSQIGHGPKNSN